MPKQYTVILSKKERDELRIIIKKGKNAAQIKRAYILLNVDACVEGKQMTDKAICRNYKVGIRTVERLRKRFVTEGIEIAIKGRVHSLSKEESKKHTVTLSKKERDELISVVKKGKNAAQIRKSHILLGTDASVEGKQMSDQAICKAYSVSIGTVERLRKRFVTEGIEIALKGKPVDMPKPRKIDGDVEAHLIALTRSKAPDGYKQWSFRLLADKIVELEYIDSISYESVRQVLKKTNSNPISVYAG